MEDYILRFQREINKLKKLLEKVEYLIRKYKKDDLKNWEVAEVFYSVGLKTGELLKKIIKRLYIFKFEEVRAISEMVKAFTQNEEILKIIKFRDTLTHSYYELKDYEKALYNQIKRIYDNLDEIKRIIKICEESLSI